MTEHILGFRAGVDVLADGDDLEQDKRQYGLLYQRRGVI